MGSPGDLSEIRGILTVISFLSIFVLITSLIPYQFLVPQSGNRGINVPDEYDSGEVLSIAETKTYSLGPPPGSDYHFTFGGQELTLFTRDFPFTGVTLQHSWTEYFFLHYSHYMDWYSSNNTVMDVAGEIPLATIEANINDTYYVRCQHTQIHAQFGYNETDYDSATEAYLASDLGIWLGIDWNETATTFNAWNLIGMILFFQSPDIHPVLNALIAIPIWITIAYLIYTLITKLIPFT